MDKSLKYEKTLNVFYEFKDFYIIIFLIVFFIAPGSPISYYFSLLGTVAGTIVQHSLAQLFNNGWHDCSTVTGAIAQQSLALLFNSHWHDSSTIAGTTVQHLLAQLFNSCWHNC